VECAVVDNRIETRVTDTGIGIRQEDFNKLFNAFQQLETGLTRRYEGSGLGLSICKKLVELMGGRIWVQSCLGQGSTFAFLLPLRQPANESDSGQ
jgi:signal transduction histidine kinase